MGPKQRPTSRKVEIPNERGLHARAAAQFVRVAEQFDAEITVAKGELKVPGTSIMGLMMLGAARGALIEIAGTGEEAEAAVAALAALVEAGFHEGT